jgi:hypothetical protein
MIGELPIDFIQTESGRTKVAPERFKSDMEISDVCNAMIAADRLRIPWRAGIDGLINGNPTYSLDRLKAKNQGWRARVNYREAEGHLQMVQTPFYDLVSEVNPCVEVCLDYGKGVDQSDWANKIAKNFHWMLQTMWRMGFNYHVPLQQLEMLKHGLGYHIWPGSKDCWIPRTPLSGQVLFPDGATLNLEEDLDYFMLRDFLPGFALYRHIENEENATKIGWNVETVWNALAQTAKRKPVNLNRWSAEMMQREMRAGDVGTTQSRQAGLWLNHLFVREIESGRVSQYTVAEEITPNSGKASSDKFAKCLFRKRDRFEEWPLVIFPYDIGTDGTLHTVRGLGARTKAFFELSNRITNAMVDQVLTGSRYTVKQTGSTDPNQLKLLQLGMMNILPQGVEPMNGLQFPPLAQGPIALRQELLRTVRGNNENYMQGTPEPRDRETAQSFTMRTQNSGQVGKGMHSLYAGNYQMFLDRTYRTAARPSAAVGGTLSARMAKKFQQQCLKDGVPAEALQNVYEIKEILSTGAGSAAARIDALMTIMKVIYPTTTEARKINIERDVVSSLVTSSKVDRYARSHDDNQMPGNDASFAAVENSAMENGDEAIVSEMQDHVAHNNVHFPKAGDIAQAALAGQSDPQKALIAVQQFGQHIGKHLAMIRTNPFRKAEYDQQNKEWLALGAIADKLQQQVAAAAAAQPKRQPAQQISDDLQVGLARVASDERLNAAKLATKSRYDIAKLGIDSRIESMRVANQARNGAAAK